MEYSFPRYLLAKQTVDERALNQHVLNTLKAALPKGPLRIIEVGGGIGTMIPRLLRWNLLEQADYTLVDELPENIAFAQKWLPDWARENGYAVETLPDASLRLSALRQQSVPVSVSIHFAQADVFDFIQKKPQPADLLIAHAFLDLLPMPESLTGLFSLLKPQGLAWLTINFDGVTTLEPAIRLSALRQPSAPKSVSSPTAIDAIIEHLYHQSMDARPTGGDSQAGRHLFGHLQQVGAQIFAAGASDWVVYPLNGQYPADEAYFLHFILHFFETSLKNHPELDPDVFTDWLIARHHQIESAELVYIAHQMDFLAKPKGV